MKYKTLFRLLIRLLGVSFIGTGIGHIFYIGGPIVINWFTARSPSQWYFVFYPIVEALGFLFVGLYLFYGGDWVLNQLIPSNRPYCHECGYDLTGAVGNICPECGTAFKPAVDPEPHH